MSGVIDTTRQYKSEAGCDIMMTRRGMDDRIYASILQDTGLYVVKVLVSPDEVELMIERGLIPVLKSDADDDEDFASIDTRSREEQAHALEFDRMCGYEG